MSVFRNLLMQSTGWLGKPSDWSDIRKDCPANSIALYAGHTADYSQYDNLGFTATMGAALSFAGALTNTDGIVSGFGSGKYVQTTNPIDTSKEIEFYGKITTGNDVSTSQMIFCSNMINASTNGLALQLSGGLFRFFIPNSSNLYFNGLQSISINTTYYFRVHTSGNKSWTFEYGTQPNDYIDTISGTGNITPILTAFRLGLHQSTGGYPFLGSIDLNNTYMQQGSTYIFAPYNLSGYKVFIDETLYNSYNSGAQCNITWSTSGITTGDNITTPSALKAHKIWIEPATEGNNITAFQCKRVAASGTEYQGVLWAHFNLTNTIKISELFCSNYPYNCQQKLLKAFTAKNNLVRCSSHYANASFANTTSLEYIPIIDNLYVGISCFYYSTKIKTIKLTNSYLGLEQYCFDGCNSLKELKISNPRYGNSGNFNSFLSSTMLKKFPDLDWSKVKQANDIWTDYNRQLNDGEPTIIDARAGNQITKLGIRNTNSLVGLRVSNEAPFTGATPQINVSNTNLDRQALVQLFNDLPYNVGYEVVGSPTITDGVASGFSSSDYVNTSLSLNNTEEDFEIVISVIYKNADSGLANFIGGPFTLGGSYIYGQKLSSYIRNTQDAFLFQGAMGLTAMSNNTPYLLKIEQKKVNQQFVVSIYLSSDNGQTWVLQNTASSNYPVKTSSPFIFGSTGNASLPTQYFRGSIDINNTYIKINDVYWFRGNAQRASKPELTITGCTGTADLTTADKQIAEIDKFWKVNY